MLFDPLLAVLEQELRTDFHKYLAGLLATARTQLEGVLAEVAKERAQGLAEVATQKAELRHEIDAMQTHQEQQQGRIELNIGGHNFQTSVQTLRRLPHTFFDAYFSGRYAQDVCLDGSVFVDRAGEHFGHVLEYMRDGVVSVAEAGAHSSVSLLRALKHEFGYYCIELVAKPAYGETAYVMGGKDGQVPLSSMEWYDAASDQWSAATNVGTARSHFGACVIEGEVYVIGGLDAQHMQLESVEKYSPLSNAWIAVAPMSVGRYCHVTVAVSSSIYVLGGFTDDEGTGMDVLKFDSTQGTWSDDSPAPREIIKSAAVAVGTDIYVFGGADEAGNDADFVMKYDTVADEWSILAPMPEDFSCHSASICNGLVYIAGAGYDGQGVLQFDPASGVWSTLSPALSERCYGATFVLGGVLHVAGGELTGSSRAERYDPDTDTWTEVANMLEKRSSFGALTIGSEEPAEEQGLFDFLIDKALHRQL